MRKYKSYEEFYSANQARFDAVQKAAALLKSPTQLGNDSAMGLAMAEAETLSHFFLSVANSTTDLLFGVSASVLDAEASVSSTEGVLYGQKSGGATDRNRAVASDTVYLSMVQNFNDLKDLKSYLERKHEDMMSNHYYYKGLVGGNKR